MNPIHRITRWSGKPEDEAPICGADPNASGVWNCRTVSDDHVTCERCKSLTKAVQK